MNSKSWEKKSLNWIIDSDNKLQLKGQEQEFYYMQFGA